MVLLYCDGYLCLKEPKEQEGNQKTLRFLKIAEKLPLELLMQLVRRIYLSSEIMFLTQTTEDALIRVLSSPF